MFCNDENNTKLYKLSLIEPFLDQTLRNLSSGEIKMVEVLIIIHSKAEFVLLEEPFSGLSPILTEMMTQIIKEMSKEKGFIISDFNTEQVLNISDNIYLLSDAHLRPIKDLTELQRFNYLPKNI